MRQNLVGHCYRPGNNNDKVYMCCIRKTGPSAWVLLAKWGRRGKRLSNQPKGTFSTEATATAAQQSLWKDRQKEGYLDIESPEYQANIKKEGRISPLKMDSPGVREHLEGDDGLVGAAGSVPDPVPLGLVEWDCENCGKKFKPVPNDSGNFAGVKSICPGCIEKAKKAARKRAAGEDEVLVCVDNSGMEDRFDVGIEYIVEEHKDTVMLYAWDKMGRKDEYFKTRFMTPEQWAAKQGKMVVSVLKNREADPSDPKVIVTIKPGEKLEFMKFKPGETVTVRRVPGSPVRPVSSASAFDPDLTEDQIKKLLAYRGGCTCSAAPPPCSACSESITREEYDELGFGRSAKMPTRKTAGAVA